MYAETARTSSSGAEAPAGHVRAGDAFAHHAPDEGFSQFETGKVERRRMQSVHVGRDAVAVLAVAMSAIPQEDATAFFQRLACWPAAGGTSQLEADSASGAAFGAVWTWSNISREIGSTRKSANRTRRSWSSVGGSRMALSLVRLRVVDGELLERCAGHAQRGGFLGGAVGVPVVHDHALDHPHRRRRGCRWRNG